MSTKLLTVLGVLLLLGLVMVPAGAAGRTDYTKIFVIPLMISETGVTPGTVILDYGYSPRLGLQSGTFRGELADTKGTVITSFPVWDPRISFGDSLAKKRDGTVSKVSGILEKRDSAEVTIVVPFAKNSGAFNLYNTNGSRVSSVDLIPVIRNFCAANPGDPDCAPAAGSLPLLIGGALVILVLAAGAGWYFLKKRKPQEK